MISAFDSEVRLECFLDYVIKQVLPQYGQRRRLKVECAYEPNCFAILCGLYDSYELTGKIEPLWNRRHDVGFSSELQQIRTNAQATAQSMGLTIEPFREVIESEEDFKSRVTAAWSRGCQGLEVVLVPTEVLHVISPVGEKIILCAHSDPKMKGERCVQEFVEFCALHSLAPYRMSVYPAEHCSSQLRSCFPNVPFTDQEGQLQIPDSLSQEQQADILQFLQTRCQAELAVLQQRPLYYRTAITHLTQAWKTLAQQFQPWRGELAILQAKVEAFEREKGEDMANFRSLTTDSQLQDALAEVEQIRKELIHARDETCKLNQALSVKLVTLETKTEAIEASLPLFRPSNVSDVRMRPQNSEEAMTLRVEIECAKALSGLAVELYAEPGIYHICCTDINLHAGLNEIRVHRHFLPSPSILLLRKGRDTIGSLNLDGCELSPELCNLAEQTLQVIGYENSNPHMLDFLKLRTYCTVAQVVSEFLA